MMHICQRTCRPTLELKLALLFNCLCRHRLRWNSGGGWLRYSRLYRWRQDLGEDRCVGQFLTVLPGSSFLLPSNSIERFAKLAQSMSLKASGSRVQP
jgi:hypothetical protein